MRKTGRVTLKANGETLRSQPGASLQPGGLVREDEMSDQGEHFYTENEVPSEIRATFIHATDDDATALRSFIGVLTYECDTGQIYTVNGAVFKESGDLSNGEIEVTFGGPPAVLA